MGYNRGMSTEKWIEKRRKKESAKRWAKRLRTPVMIIVSVIITGLFIMPAIAMGAADWPANASGLALNIGAPGFMLQTPSPSPSPVQTPAPDSGGKDIPLLSDKGVSASYLTYKSGDQDKTVASIQARLMELDFMDYDEPSELYSPATEAAIRRFQNAHHMVETGVADELTQNILFSPGAKVYIPSRGDKGNDVLSIQSRLKELSYYEGKLNGYFGAATQRALKEFQLKNELEPSGVADRDTRDLIYSPMAKPKVDATPTPTTTPRPSQTPRPSTTPRPTSTPRVTPTPRPNTTPGVTESPVIPSPTPTDAIMPDPSPTPTPRVTTPPPINNGDVGDFIAIAEAQLGKPYIYADEGPDSFDCSGLVYYCLRQVGVSTSRYSADGFSQVEKWAKVIGKENLQRGDLIFFLDKPGGTRMGHTGIWYGNNSYLHASSSSGKVMISSWSPWAEDRFAFGRRVF